MTNVFSQRDWSAFLEHAEDHGVIEEPVLDAFALEHELDDEEVAALRAELEARGVEIEGSPSRPLSAPRRRSRLALPIR